LQSKPGTAPEPSAAKIRIFVKENSRQESSELPVGFLAKFIEAIKSLAGLSGQRFGEVDSKRRVLVPCHRTTVRPHPLHDAHSAVCAH
jgi:hypothetical protein